MFGKRKRGARRTTPSPVTTALVIHVDGTVDCAYLNPATPARTIAFLVGGAATRCVDPELGLLDFWTGTGQTINPHASALLGAVLAAAASGDLDVGPDRRTRIGCLRAHGWEPVLRGICVVTGTNAHELPTAFLTWLGRQPIDRIPAATLAAEIEGGTR